MRRPRLNSDAFPSGPVDPRHFSITGIQPPLIWWRRGRPLECPGNQKPGRSAAASSHDSRKENSRGGTDFVSRRSFAHGLTDAEKSRTDVKDAVVSSKNDVGP